MRTKAFLIVFGLCAGIAVGDAGKPAPRQARPKPKVIDLDFTDDDDDEAPAARQAAHVKSSSPARPWIYWTLGATAVAAGGVGWYLYDQKKAPVVTRSEQVFTDERP
jgi:hypothetical protein